MVLAKPLSRILYVDDDASMRELVRTALAAQSEFSVVTCASGFEALIIVGQLRPDLILMDVAIPRMDGVQTLECLRALDLEFSVVTCASGFEALIIVGQLRPDLILMDVAIPRMDGVQTLECLRAMEL